MEPIQSTTKNKAPWPVVTEETLENSRAKGETLRVRCIAPEGIYYNFARRREGDVFDLVPKKAAKLAQSKGTKQWVPVMENGKPVIVTISAREQFSEQTMEIVEDGEAESLTTAQMALDRKSAELRSAKSGR
jgi:hypothetical protein